MRKTKMWRMLTVAAVTASMTCGVFGVQSVSAADKKTLKVAMECGYAPYNWTQPDDSNGAVQISGSSDYAYGYDVMMAKKIADELGYDLEIVKLDWDSLVPAVQSGQVDCVIAGQSITKERQQMVDFTDPYYYASIITLVKEDGDYKDAASVEDLKGATVTSQQNTIWYDSCLPQALRNIMPQIGNNLIINIKDTCVLSIIGTVELFYTTKGVAGALYTYFESFTIAMVIYFIMTFTCSRILRVIERKMDGPDNYDLATADTLTHTSGMYSYKERKDSRE